MAHLKQYCARAAAWPLAVALAPSRYDGRALWERLHITAQCYILGQWLPKTAAFDAVFDPAGKLCGGWQALRQLVSSVAVDKL